jgi:uncharacterized membrane protein YgcG
MISKSRLRGWVEDARSDAREGPVTVVGRLLRFAVLAAKKFNRDNCFQRASALGFATLISLIPLLVLFFSLAGAFGEGDKIIAWVRDTGFRYLAPDFQKDLDEFLVQNISKSAFAQGKTGLVYFGAVVGLLLAAFGMASTAERYMNVIFEAPRKRSYLQKLMTFWVVLTVSPFFIVLSLWVGEWAFRDGSFVSDLRRAAPFLGTASSALRPSTSRCPRRRSGRSRRLSAARRRSSFGRSSGAPSSSTSNAKRPSRASTASSPRCRSFSSGSTSSGSSCSSARRSRSSTNTKARSIEGSARIEGAAANTRCRGSRSLT